MGVNLLTPLGIINHTVPTRALLDLSSREFNDVLIAHQRLGAKLRAAYLEREDRNVLTAYERFNNSASVFATAIPHMGNVFSPAGPLPITQRLIFIVQRLATRERPLSWEDAQRISRQWWRPVNWLARLKGYR